MVEISQAILWSLGIINVPVHWMHVQVCVHEWTGFEVLMLTYCASPFLAAKWMGEKPSLFSNFRLICGHWKMVSMISGSPIVMASDTGLSPSLSWKETPQKTEWYQNNYKMFHSEYFVNLTNIILCLYHCIHYKLYQYMSFRTNDLEKNKYW